MSEPNFKDGKESVQGQTTGSDDMQATPPTAEPYASDAQQPVPPANPYNPYAQAEPAGSQVPSSPSLSQDEQQTMPTSQTPEPNRRYPQAQPGYAEVKKVQNLALAASVCGPVSVFIGGMLLSGIGIGCAFAGMRKADKIEPQGNEVEAAVKRARKSCIVAMVICAVAFVLNALYAFYLYPVLIEAVQSGDVSSLINNGAMGEGSASSSSTWG